MNWSIKTWDEAEFKVCVEFEFSFSVKGEKSEDGFSSVMNIMKFNYVFYFNSYNEIG